MSLPELKSQVLEALRRQAHELRLSQLSAESAVVRYRDKMLAAEHEAKTDRQRLEKVNAEIAALSKELGVES